jgi:hypothetical protein
VEPDPIIDRQVARFTLAPNPVGTGSIDVERPVRRHGYGLDSDE